TEQGTTEALAALEKTEKALVGRNSLFDVYWLRGRILEEQKQSAEAQAQYVKATNEATPNWKEKEKILWSLTWSFFKTADYKKAIEHLDSMINAPEISTTSRFKYLYWKGEAFQRQELPKEARAIWEKLATDDTYGYYGLLAHHQIDRPLDTFTGAIPESTSVLSSPEAKIFNALIKVEEMEFAQKMLVEKMSDDSKVLQMSVEDISALFQKLSQVNSYSTVFSYFTKLPYDTQKQVFYRIPKTLFPSPYLDLVTKAAKDASIEAELIYSIMRQESSFNPMARSPMDAFGLLQVLPDVAKRVARKHKLPYKRYEDLYIPEINLPIGAHLLRTQNVAFDNKFVLMVASYNASSSAVRSWHKRYNGDDLMFIEDIPYEETKAYVKLVTRNLVLYKKLLYGEEFRAFPRHLLEL
ncbi:MAG: lytic transglycosylase domain-containing protein, partial [Bdellovibrionaceae bacterium]|nr:lytic transglycosylase domain-containing protein [Pseudobdellovibrionaceae bacterium]